MIERKFDLDDILIVPAKKSHIVSRYSDIQLKKTLPLFTAPMDTVVDLTNIDIFIDNNINVVLPRTVTYKDFKVKCLDVNFDRYKNTFISFGFNDFDLLLKNNLKDLHHGAHILLDIANGHMQKIVDYCTEFKRLRSDIIIMVGNVANPKTFEWYVKSGTVDYIRLSIGTGNGCLTGKNSAVGYPLASLLIEINDLVIKYKGVSHITPKIIADGGMKEYSDIIKSLALGADGVMLGSIFNKSFESCSNNYIYGIKIKSNNLAKYLYDKGFPIKKHYRGMSTKEVQRKLNVKQIKTSEGVHRIRKVEYYLSGWIENFNHYLRNTMSYCGCKTLEDFIGNVEYILITKSSYVRFDK